MYGIEPEGIDMIIFQPKPGILQDIIADAIGPGIIEVQCFPPGSLVFIRKIGTELVEVITFRTEVIVDHIDDDGYTFSMCSIDKTLKAGDAAIRILYGERDRHRHNPSCGLLETVPGA